MPLKILLVVALAALTGAGCAVSGGASAVSVRSENGHVSARSWSGGVGCEVGPGVQVPCSAQSGEVVVP
jgi:hypothetical protein